MHTIYFKTKVLDRAPLDLGKLFAWQKKDTEIVINCIPSVCFYESLVRALLDEPG